MGDVHYDGRKIKIETWGAAFRYWNRDRQDGAALRIRLSLTREERRGQEDLFDDLLGLEEGVNVLAFKEDAALELYIGEPLLHKSINGCPANFQIGHKLFFCKIIGAHFGG